MSKVDKWVQRWKVPKSIGDGDWTVALGKDGSWGCNCPKWKFNFPRRDCDHIKRVRGGEFDAPTAKKAKYVLANVAKPKYNPETNELLVPLIALPDTRMMEATVVYYMLRHGFTMPEIREIRHLPKEWTKEAVVAHVETHGEAEYPADWFKRPGKDKLSWKKRLPRVRKRVSTLRGLRR